MTIIEITLSMLISVFNLIMTLQTMIDVDRLGQLRSLEKVLTCPTSRTYT